MATTPTQIEAIRELAGKLAAADGIEQVIVDDWGRFGNFSLHVTPSKAQSQPTRRIRSLLKLHLPHGAHVREVLVPRGVYKRQYPGGPRKRVGYDFPYWGVDIDFQEYHAASNTFSEALAP
jgi:hypothetical protein